MPGESAYVDTSIIGAYYSPETLSEKAESALLAIEDPVLSNLCDVEFASLIARKQKLKDLSERQAIEILQLFDSHMAQGFYRRVSLSADHFLRARQLVAGADGSLRTLDALHLAVAVVEILPLLTADRELAKAARRFKVEVILIN